MPLASMTLIVGPCACLRALPAWPFWPRLPTWCANNARLGVWRTETLVGIAQEVVEHKERAPLTRVPYPRSTREPADLGSSGWKVQLGCTGALLVPPL
jgi:hypothetical protein